MKIKIKEEVTVLLMEKSSRKRATGVWFSTSSLEIVQYKTLNLQIDQPELNYDIDGINLRR